MIFPAVRQNLQLGFAACGVIMISVAVLSGGARVGLVMTYQRLTESST